MRHTYVSSFCEHFSFVSGWLATSVVGSYKLIEPSLLCGDNRNWPRMIPGSVTTGNKELWTNVKFLYTEPFTNTWLDWTSLIRRWMRVCFIWQLKIWGCSSTTILCPSQRQRGICWQSMGSKFPADAHSHPAIYLTNLLFLNIKKCFED